MGPETVFGLLIRLLTVAVSFLGIRYVLVRRYRTRAAALIGVFVVYIGTTTFFACVYQFLFLDKPTRFAFHHDISTTRKEALAAADRDVLETLDATAKALGQLAHLLREPKLVVSITEEPFGWLGAEFKTTEFYYKFSLSPLWEPDRVNNRFVRRDSLLVRDSAGRRLSEQWFSTPGLPSEMGKQLTFPATVDPDLKSRDFFERAAVTLLRESTTRRAALSSQDPVTTLKRLWSFADFMYFSTVTISTVGYGDILPNDSIVRLVVILQVFAGILLLGIVVNLVTQRPSEAL